MDIRFSTDRILFETTDEVDGFLRQYNEDLTDRSWNFLFFNPFIKAYCFDTLAEKFGYDVINCDTTLTRFCDLIQDCDDNVVFDGVDHCTNSDILDILENSKGIFVTSIP